MLNAQGLQNVDNRIHSKLRKEKDREDDVKFQEKYQDVQQLDGSYKRQLVRINVPDFHDRNNSNSFFVGRANYDDFSNKYDEDRVDVAVEFSQYDLDRYGDQKEPVPFIFILKTI